MQCRFFWSAVVDGDLSEDVFRARFEVLHEDIPVTIAIENAGIDQFVLVDPASLAGAFSSTSSAYGNSHCGYL